MEYLGNPIEHPVRIHHHDTYFDLPPFLPDASFIKAVNQTLNTGWPLLLIGDRFRSMIAVKAIAYELYGVDFMDNYLGIPVKKDSRIKELVYSYDHESRKRDLEYYSYTQDKNFFNPQEFYLQKGPLIDFIELENTDQGKPILEFRDLHNADKDFVRELTEFFMMYQEVIIPETGETFRRKHVGYPILILTAKENYQLSPEYEGIIYKHELYQTKEQLLEETLLKFQAAAVDGKEKLISRMIDLFDLLRNSTLLKTQDANYPNSILELSNSIDLKLGAVWEGIQSIEEAVKEIEEIIDSQFTIGQNYNVKDAVEEIEKLIGDNKISKAIGNLELIRGKLSKDKHVQIGMFASRFSELRMIENLQLESTLTLTPKKNRLRFDLLNFLKELEQ